VRVPPQTLVDKIWARHAIAVLDGNETLLYVDRCLLHEGFWWNIVDSLKSRNLAIHRPSNIIACSDHFVPTTDRSGGFGAIADERRRDLILRLETEGAELGVNVIGMMDERQGILHVVAPETGITQPGMVIVGSDSHTSTHGALGAIAFGIGTTEAMHVLATETLWQLQPKTMRITVEGRLPKHTTAKDLILSIIARLGIDGGAGLFIEYAGPAIEALTIEERLTVCNMSIELGARAGTIAPDEATFAYLAGRPQAPSGAHWDAAVAFWKTLRTDDGAKFDREVRIDGASVAPMATWGTSLDQTIALDAPIPDPATEPELSKRDALARSLVYMGLHPGQRLRDVPIDYVFIGSCTNGRLDDLREAAAVVRGRHAAVPAFVSPGSRAVKRAAEAEGLDRIFLDAGFEWRDSGCSMCAGANGDTLQPGQRCAATSNRNFPGRQGPDSRTHIMSPASAAASAIAGHIAGAAQVLV
jgi:3-isopropylmalate/(R)-2-methylmalate dehydratase large subunit